MPPPARANALRVDAIRAACASAPSGRCSARWPPSGWSSSTRCPAGCRRCRPRRTARHTPPRRASCRASAWVPRAAAASRRWRAASQVRCMPCTRTLHPHPAPGLQPCASRPRPRVNQAHPGPSRPRPRVSPGTVEACVAWLGRSERGAAGQIDPLWPALATLLLAFFVARAFASVYECVVRPACRERPSLAAPQLGTVAQPPRTGSPGSGLPHALKSARAARICTKGVCCRGQRMPTCGLSRSPPTGGHAIRVRDARPGGVRRRAHERRAARRHRPGRAEGEGGVRPGGGSGESARVRSYSSVTVDPRGGGIQRTVFSHNFRAGAPLVPTGYCTVTFRIDTRECREARPEEGGEVGRDLHLGSRPLPP